MSATNLIQVLKGFDDTDDRTDERKISTAIKGTLPKDSLDAWQTAYLAEAIAFDFCENYPNGETSWGTYYGPMMVWSNDDGTVSESPSIRQINVEVLDYWASRANDAKTPILKARYADLVWEMSKPATGMNPDVSMAHIAIDSILDMAENDRHEHEVHVVTKLERALSLAISLNDPDRIARVRDTMIAYEDKIAVDDALGLWGFSFDQLTENRKTGLTKPQLEKLISDLEIRLDRVSQLDKSGKVDPWAAQAAATRLASYYRSENRQADVKRVLMKHAGAFEEASKSAAPLQASAWLQGVHSVLLRYDMREEAEQITLKLRELGPEANAEMKPISHSVEIQREEMERYVESIVGDSLDSALERVAIHFVPRKKEVEEQVKELAKKAPITFLIPRQIQDEKGRPVATVGSLKDDPTGHFVLQVSQNMSISSIFLRAVMEEVIRRFGLTVEMFADYLFLSPIFQENKLEIVKKGLRAYLEDNHLVAAHLLVPQVEDAIRNLVENVGGSVLRRGRGGGFQVKLLDELLREEQCEEVLGEDVVLYFRILLTDQRGWNLRNGISHGLLGHDVFGAAMTDRIVHVLLYLALIRERGGANQSGPST